MAITFKSVLASGGSGAVITVTYSSEFYNQTLTATNGTDTVTALATSAGTVDITVPSAGSWVVSCTISGETYTSETVSVDLSYSTELVAIPDGSTVTPTDDVQTWLKCAGIKDKNYTTLSQVLADSVTFNALLGDSNACAYMARSTTWAATLCADQYAMSMIGQYDVCCDALLGNETWASAIFNSTYASYIINASVPTMTSNTTPSGECIGANDAYKAFDGNNSTRTTETALVGYRFTSDVFVKRATYRHSSANPRTIVGKYSDDGLTWTVCSEQVTVSGDGTETEVWMTASDAHAYWGLCTADGVEVLIPYTIQFYGHKETGELIHGTTNESAYYLDNGTEVAIVDPSTLSAGTYTFGSTVAKDPSDLTADYTKSIRITPNTVEVVLRPDKSIYWYGKKVQSMVFRTGGGSYTFVNGTLTDNTNSITVTLPASTASRQTSYVSEQSVSGGTVKVVVKSATVATYSSASIVQHISYTNGTTKVSGGTICYSSAVTTPTLFSDTYAQENAQVGIYIQDNGNNNLNNKCEISALWRE